MKLKKTLSLILVATFLLLAAGCGEFADKLTNTITNAPKTGEETYRELNSLMISPSSLDNSDWYKKKIEFSALFFTEPFDMEVEMDDGEMVNCTYQYAGISRNSQDYLLIDVSKLEEPAVKGEYYTVAGSITGYISYDDDEDGNPVKDDIEILATAITPLPINEDLVVDSAASVSVTTPSSSGDFVFKRAHFDTELDTQYVILYYDFKNTGDKETTPPTSEFFVYQGDNLLVPNTHFLSGENLDPEATGGAFLGKTAPNDTTYCYLAFSPAKDDVVLTDDPIEILLYNDDFDNYYLHELPIEAVEAAE